MNGDSPPAALLELTNVTKDYRSEAGLVRALRAVNLTIEQGEFVAIVGTSGSGKSTLMNILGCLDRPTTGSYRLAGFDVGGRTNDGRAIVRNRLIGFIFQGFNLLSRTTALENVELPLQYRGVPASARRERAMLALQQVGLGERVHHTPNQLSGGQQQRVAIARALVTDPPLLLADEPTGNLDSRTSYEVLGLLQKLNRELQITICLVTHEHDIAACASRVIVVRDGLIESDTRQAQPTDAARALAELPPPLESQLTAADRERDAASDQIARGGPIPRSAFPAMFGGLVLGAGLGLAYDALVLGSIGPVIPIIAGATVESWFGASHGAKKLGRVLSSDQRVRLSLWYTLITTALVALGVGWFLVPKLPAARLEPLINQPVPVFFGAMVLMVAVALILERYLLLTFFGSSFFRQYVAGKRA
jgi:putative ABC transport system ATP-binding protein